MLKDIQKEVDDLKKTLLPLLGNERTNFLRDLKTYVYVYCEISEDNKRIPIYIGKGKGDRCFAHLNNLEDISKTKNRKITNLLLEKKLSIDILAYGLDSQTALLIESACIDLMGIDNLANLVRGQGENCKRIPLAELTNLLTEKTVEVLPEHKGVSILINKCFKPTFGDLEIFEYTRGIWPKSMMTVSGDSKYAYATIKGVVKEVYEIHSWVPAGTQEYFTRELDPERLSSCKWEFVGRKAPEEIRKLYVGKIIKKDRSYGSSFIPVG